MDGRARTVTLSVASREEVVARMRTALGGEGQGARITFPTVGLLWKVITPKRLGILRVLAGAGPLAIREVARRVGRDVKAVHGDVHALLDAGILVEEGRGVSLPYDAVHVDFTLKAA